MKALCNRKHRLFIGMARDKKQQEREVLDAFRKHYDDFPKGKMRASESPDFIIIASRKKKYWG
jgi:hypothetical protein